MINRQNYKILCLEIRMKTKLLLLSTMAALVLFANCANAATSTPVTVTIVNEYGKTLNFEWETEGGLDVSNTCGATIENGEENQCSFTAYSHNPDEGAQSFRLFTDTDHDSNYNQPKLSWDYNVWKFESDGHNGDICYELAPQTSECTRSDACAWTVTFKPSGSCVGSPE